MKTPTPINSGNDTTSERLAPVTFLPWAVPEGKAEPVPQVRDEVEHAPQQQDEAVFEFDEGERDRVDRLVLRSLARRGLSEWEVREMLRQNEVPSEEHDEWIARLVRLGYVDDAVLAEQLVRTHHERKGLGASAVAQELKKRHIDPLVISESLEALDGGEEIERATAIALKRVGQLASYDEATAERRLTGFLMRRGYPGGVVRAAVGTALATRGRGGVRFR